MTPYPAKKGETCVWFRARNFNGDLRWYAGCQAKAGVSSTYTSLSRACPWCGARVTPRESEAAMTPREKIETLRRLREKAREAPPGTDEALAAWEACSDAVYESLDELLDVAEAAARFIEENFSDQEAVPCDLGPEECSACNLEQALARLGEEP